MLLFLDVTLKRQAIERALREEKLLFDLILFVHQQSFSYIGTGLPGLNQY